MRRKNSLHRERQATINLASPLKMLIIQLATYDGYLARLCWLNRYDNLVIHE